MAPGDRVAPNTTIYRALSKKYYDKDLNQPKEIAFLLRPVHDNWPDETSLSFGTSPAAAIAGLTKIVRVCEIEVSDVVGLGYGLEVTEDEDPQKLCVSGMPLPTVNEEFAHQIAKDLRRKCKICKCPELFPLPASNS